jgi:hypothetical protein
VRAINQKLPKGGVMTKAELPKLTESAFHLPVQDDEDLRGRKIKPAAIQGFNPCPMHVKDCLYAGFKCYLEKQCHFKLTSSN